MDETGIGGIFESAYVVKFSWSYRADRRYTNHNWSDWVHGAQPDKL